jgi:hypothetical protein
MAQRKGKKAKYVTYAQKGLLEDDIWKKILKDYPTELLCSLRKNLKSVPGLTEKFNRKTRYFGYCTGNDKDRLYIYVQKKRLQIDLCIDKENEKKIKDDHFEVVFVNNFQGRNNWITGWRVPHNAENKEIVMKWLLKAFDKNL